MLRLTVVPAALLVSLMTTSALAETFERRGSIGARDRQETTLWIPANQTVTLTVVGDGDTDLDLYVYDSAGNLLAYDDDATDVCVVQWTQRRAGSVTVVLRNLGDVYNAYHWTRETEPRFFRQTSW
jgi:hypothetical protein